VETTVDASAGGETDRRGRIVAAATRLFGERGFHQVGIDEIGTAAGMSGPAIYRYFGGKEVLFAATFRSATAELWRYSDVETEGLECHVRAHVRYAVQHPEAIELWYREARHLPAPARAAQRRLQRRFVDRWVEVLRAERPGLTAREAHTMVEAALGLVHSTIHADRGTEVEVVAPVLERMALAALRA
jgi:AcrR family transcriptional regulator